MMQIAIQMPGCKKEDMQYWNIDTSNAELMDISMDMLINEIVFNILSIKQNPNLNPKLCMKIFVTKRSLGNE